MNREEILPTYKSPHRFGQRGVRWRWRDDA